MPERKAIRTEIWRPGDGRRRTARDVPNAGDAKDGIIAGLL